LHLATCRHPALSSPETPVPYVVGGLNLDVFCLGLMKSAFDLDSDGSNPMQFFTFAGFQSIFLEIEQIFAKFNPSWS
jgi:hypothetical protein